MLSIKIAAAHEQQVNICTQCHINAYIAQMLVCVCACVRVGVCASIHVPLLIISVRSQVSHTHIRTLTPHYPPKGHADTQIKGHAYPKK